MSEINYIQTYGNYVSGNIKVGIKSLYANNYDEALFTDKVEINGVSILGLVKQEKKSENKKLLLRPESKLDIGSIVKIGESNYLTVDFLGEGIYEIYPTATLKLCNSTFPITTNKTSVLIGKNEFGEDMYEWQGGDLIELPCVATYMTYSDNTNEAINLPEGQIEIWITYIESKEIADGKEFTMYGAKFHIIGIDYTKSINKVGLLKIKGKKV